MANNVLKNAQAELMTAFFYGDDEGNYIPERQTINKLSALVGLDKVEQSFLGKDEESLKEELGKYGVDYNFIVKSHNEIRNENNNNEFLGKDIDKHLIVGMANKIFLGEEVDLELFEDNLFTESMNYGIKGFNDVDSNKTYYDLLIGTIKEKMKNKSAKTV